MKIPLGAAVLFFFGLPIGSQAQTTIANLDEDPITAPNQANTNLRHWGYAVGPGVGCSGLCNPQGSEMQVGTYSVDGRAIQLDLLSSNNCGNGGCYGDLDFSDKIYLNDATASNAKTFTLDLYATGDNSWNTNSQATEFTIEQDVPSTAANGSGLTDRYIYSLQCNRKGDTVHPGPDGGPPTGGIWNIWDGTLRNGQGDWVAALTTSGSTVPCQAFQPGHFIHYYFHFIRIPSNRQIQFTDFTMVDDQGHSTYYPFDITKTTRGIQVPQANWATGLFTALQLDGDSFQTPYSVWADQWKVAYQ
jgi:hypothetical protein